MTDRNPEDLHVFEQRNNSNTLSPVPSTSKDNLGYKGFYKDVFCFGEENKPSSDTSSSDRNSNMIGDDPMNDPQFMAFLACIPYESAMDTPEKPSTEKTGDKVDNSKSPGKKRDIKANQKRPPSTRFGFCEHPKHNYYRQEKYLWNSSTVNQALVMKAIPRRGRPPKGSKPTEHMLSTSSVYHHELGQFPSVELTVRSLPKRLESVVGKSNIKVCLTCLKRSDTDPDYLQNEFYLGPQHQPTNRKKEK